MNRLGINDEDGDTGAEEVVSFIDLQPNNLTKLPEKGILKKHGGYGIVMTTSLTKEPVVGSRTHEGKVQRLRSFSARSQFEIQG